MPVLADVLTFQLGDTGVTLNGDDSVLPFVDIDDVAGLDSAPFRTSQRDHEGTDGDFMDAEFETGRDIILSGTVYADSDFLETYLDSIRLNYQPSKVLVPFYFSAPGVAERVMFVKPLGAKYDWTVDRRLGQVPIQFSVHAEDPRIYSSQVQQAVMSMGSIIVFGRTYNKSYNYGYGTIITVPDDNSIFNNGNRDAPATIRITGPCSNPAIVSDTAGMTLQFIIDLGVGETLDINLLTHTVILNGTTNRRNTLQDPNWFLLSQGQNILRFRAASGSGSATVTFRDTWR